MPLKLAKDRRFSWPVKVMRPDGGEWKTLEFTAHFLAFTSQDLDQLGALALSEHLVGREGIQDAGGQPGNNGAHAQ